MNLKLRCGVRTYRLFLKLEMEEFAYYSFSSVRF